MVITRGALLQDQEQQRRLISSLRLHYFIAIRGRRMDPITPYSEKIDLRTEHGRKIYEACTKALPVVFDGAAGKHHSFLTALKNVADERSWREICMIPIGTPPIVYDLLTQPGKIKLQDLQTYCARIWSGTSQDIMQQQIKINMMGVCLMNSVSVSVSQRLDSDKEKWFFKARGGKDGLIIFKLLMQYSLQTMRYGSESTKDKLHSLNVKAFGNNVENMLLYRKTLLDDILAQGEVFSEDLYWTFKCLETVREPDSFIRYIEDKKSEWEDGVNMTSEELCKFAENRYKHVFEAGKWKFSSVLSGAEPKEKDKEDSKFIALVAAVKELSKVVGKQPDNSDHQKNKWKFEAPVSGASIEKEVNGKSFWWCNGSDGKNHKPMYCRHKPTECTGQQSKQKPENINIAEQKNTNANNNANGSNAITPKAGPKLKLNSNLSTALAALDKALQNSSSSDYEGKDFV